MKLCAVIASPDELAPMLRWSERICQALEAELLIVAVSNTEPLETLQANVASKGIKFRTGKPFSNLEPPYTDAVAPTIFTIDINGKFRDIIIGEEDVKKTNLDKLVGRLRQIKRDK